MRASTRTIVLTARRRDIVQTESVRAFEAERHTSLAEIQWDQSVARSEIQRIVNDAYSAYSPGKLWPVHTNDSPNAAQPFLMLYVGAAGVVWALDHLARVGASDRQRTAVSSVAR